VNRKSRTAGREGREGFAKNAKGMQEWISSRLSRDLRVLRVRKSSLLDAALGRVNTKSRTAGREGRGGFAKNAKGMQEMDFFASFA